MQTHRPRYLSAASAPPSTAGSAQETTGGFSGRRSSLGWPFAAPSGAWSRAPGSRADLPPPRAAPAQGALRPPAGAAPLGSPALHRTGWSVSRSAGVGPGPHPASPPGHGGHPPLWGAAREAQVLGGARLHCQGVVCSPGTGSSSPHLSPRTSLSWREQHRPETLASQHPSAISYV